MINFKCQKNVENQNYSMQTWKKGEPANNVWGHTDQLSKAKIMLEEANNIYKIQMVQTYCFLQGVALGLFLLL